MRPAGIRTPQRTVLSRYPPEQCQFVIRNACWLAQHGFQFDDMLAAAMLSQWNRSFLMYSSPILRSQHFSPADVLSLARMQGNLRQFVLTHSPLLGRIGFTPTDMMMLALRPVGEQTYVLQHGQFLHSRGNNSMAIRRLARDANRPPVPVPRTPRRSTTTDIPRRRADHTGSRRTATTHAPLSAVETAGFRAMGLSAEIQRELENCSEIVRTFVLTHGLALLEGTIDIETILQLVRESDQPGATPTRRDTQPGIRPDNDSLRPAQDNSLEGMFSYLTTDDIAADSLAREIHSIERRRQSPAPVGHPRNNGNLSLAERISLREAYDRWGASAVGISRDDGETFYREIVPASLSEKLGHADQYSDLRLLLAGTAYVKDNRSISGQGRHQSRVKAATDYLVNADDPLLFNSCDNAAKEAVGACGDRVSYGLTRVKQAIELRKIDHNEIPPRELFRTIERLFLQVRVEGLAAQFANERISRGDTAAANRNPASESVELYLSLSQRLASEHGMNLTETSEDSLYGGLSVFRATDDEVDRAVAHLNKHVRDLSDDFLRDFEGNNAVEQVLQRIFPEDYAAMLAARDDFTDQANDVFFDTEAVEGSRTTAMDVLTALSTEDKEWYRSKVKLVLRDPSLLD